MKQYILLKDLPDVKAGNTFQLFETSGNYVLRTDKNNLIDGNIFGYYSYPKEFVESNSEWFKPVEEPYKWNDELVCDACFYVGSKINGNEDILKQIHDALEKYKHFKARQKEDNYNNFYEKKYTEKDMRECFKNSERLTIGYFHERLGVGLYTLLKNTSNSGIKEPEFEDYLKTIKK